MQETFRPRYSDVTAIGAYENIVKPTLGDVAGAAFEEGMGTNITPSLLNLLPSVDDGRKILSPEDAAKKYQIGDLKFDSPISESRAKELYDKQFAQMRRQEIYRLGPNHVGAQAAKFGAGLASTFTDPVGLVASAVLPELLLGKAATAMGGGAKAYMTTRAGQTIGQRATFGAIEGAVGSAAFEPLVYLSQQKDQLDYGMADSFMNVAFGGILGGGFHAIGRGLELRAEAKDKVLADTMARQEAATNRLVDELDRLDVQDRVQLAKSTLSEILQDQSPRNVDATLQRYAIDRAYRGGLTEVTFKVDGSLSDNNLRRLQSKSGGNPVASIPVAKFKTNSEVDAYIKSTGKDRTSFISQRDSLDNLVVSEIRNAQVVRDGAGSIRRFKGREEAVQYMRDNGLDAQVISMQLRQGQSEQSHIVVRGLNPDEAKAISQDASFVEFYDPIPKPAILNDGASRQKYLDDNGLKLKEYKFDPDDNDNVLDFDKADSSMFDDFGDIADDDINQLNKLTDELLVEMESVDGYIDSVQRDTIDAANLDIELANNEAVALKALGFCIRNTR